MKRLSKLYTEYGYHEETPMQLLKQLHFFQIHGLQKNGGTLINKINSISKKNPKYAKQLKRGYKLLRKIGYGK